MFRSRKKSAGRRSDEHRDRDNSRVLEGYSGTDTASTPLPVRRESISTGNFQYLKLTDGFNIVLGSNSVEPTSFESTSSSSPDQSSLRKNQRNAEENNPNDEEPAKGNQTKDKLMIDVLSGTYPTQGESEKLQRESVTKDSTTKNTSTGVTPSNFSPQTRQGQSPDLLSGSPVTSETSGPHAGVGKADSPAQLAANPSPETDHTDPSISPRSEDAPTMFDDGPATPDVPAFGRPPNSKQTGDGLSGDLTGGRREGGGREGRRGVSGTEESADKHAILCDESGRDVSAKVSQSRALSRPEGTATATTTHTDSYSTHSLSYSNRFSTTTTTTTTDSEVPALNNAPSEAENGDDDKEPNKARTSTAAGSGNRPASLLGLDRKCYKLKVKAERNRTVLTHTQLNDTEESVWRLQTEQDSHAGSTHERTVTEIPAQDRSVAADADAAAAAAAETTTADRSENVVNIVENSRSSVTVLRQSVTRIGKKTASARISGAPGEKKHTVAGMFRLHRHALPSQNSPPGEKPAVYRKLDDSEQPRDTADDRTPSPDAVLREGGVPDPSDPTSGRTVRQTGSSPRPAHSPHTPPGSDSPTPLPKPKTKPVAGVYENWTIDQAVTQVVSADLDDDEDVDDDDDDDHDVVDLDSLSPGSTLDRHSAQGSKDSGLCEDVHSAGVGVVGTSFHGDGGGGADNSTAAMSSAKDGGVAEGRIPGGDGQVTSDRNEGGGTIAVDVSCVSAGDEESAIYENTALLPRPSPEDGDSSRADTPDVPDSPDGPRHPLHTAAAARLSSGHHDDHHSLTSTTTSEDDHKPALSISGDSSFDDDVDNNNDKGEDEALKTSARENMEKMRQLLVKGVLQTEKTYLAILELLLHYKRTLEGSCRTSQPVISEEDIGCIFSNLQQLRDIHKVFVEGLQGKVDAWGPRQTVGDVFMCLVEKFPEFGSYAENYQTAVAAIHRCSQDNHRFQDLAQQIVLTSTTREVTSLEDALFKPVQRLQRNTLVLYDLIKHTPKDHPDQETLQNALHLSQRNLENFGTSLVPRGKVEQKGHLVKSSFLVELVGASRKLRFIFLFSEMLVCTKREQENRGGETTFDCKWFVPLSELQLDAKFTYQDDNRFSKKDEIEDLKKKLRSVKMEMKKELKKEDKQRPAPSLLPSRTVEKLQRKANELEGQLILASPRLPLKVWHEAGKAHTFLMTTDYERQEWRELLTSLKRQSNPESDCADLSAFAVQEMVNSVRGLPEINEIGSVLMESEEEAIHGTLNITVHKLTGLTEPSDTYCCLEMDSYGHFFMKARTHLSTNTTEPSWNADFELDLEGSQTLRVLCYKKGPDKQQGDVLLCRGALEMSKSWLKRSFQEKIVTMNEYSLVLSICYTETEKTLRRTPVKHGGTAVFGVQIGACATREGKTVPTLVTACVQEVEKRGMKETGIYRVSGVTSDVQKLKKHFDKNVKVGVSNLSDVEIHTVTSLLKLYLRELPDPVFTEANYPNFLDALKLNDKEGKEKCMLSLFYNLPDINYYTAVYVLEHLLRISRYEAENKMSIHNLSTIFGPTLLAPAPEKMTLSVSDLMSLGAEHCMKQSQVVHFYLGLLARGASLRRSSAVWT